MVALTCSSQTWKQLSLILQILGILAVRKVCLQDDWWVSSPMTRRLRPVWPGGRNKGDGFRTIQIYIVSLHAHPMILTYESLWQWLSSREELPEFCQQVMQHGATRCANFCFWSFLSCTNMNIITSKGLKGACIKSLPGKLTMKMLVLVHNPWGKDNVCHLFVKQW